MYKSSHEETISHFNQIYDSTFASLETFVACRCCDPLTIQDILQDTYTEYYQVLQKKGISYVQNDFAFLTKIAARATYRYYTLKQKLSRMIPLFRDNDNGEEYCTADLPDAGVDRLETGTEQVLSSLEVERIWCIINTYPADIRKIMYLYYHEDMTLQQIAESLNLRLSTVKSKLYRTLSEIREKEESNNA